MLPVTGMGEDPLGLMPELILLLGSVATLLTGSFVSQDRQWQARAVCVATLAAATGAGALAWGKPDRMLYDGSYALDVATSTARVVVPAAALLVVATAVGRVGGRRRETEFYVLVQLASLGAVVLAGASDLLLLAVAYLLASIPLYALAGWGRDRAGAEAALKLYLLGALLGIVMLAGVSVLYGVGGGSTTYADLTNGLPDASTGAVAFGVVALLAGLLFKVGAVPAHFWVPDAVEGATVPAAAFLTTVPKVGGLIATYRVVTVLPDGVLDWRLLVAVVAAASMTLGNLAAFAQTSPLRLLAYSTISQVGYLLMAVAVADRNDAVLPALLTYLGAYAVTNLGAFAVVAAVPHLDTLRGYGGLGRERPGLAAALAVCLLGLVGIPPTAVFVGKLTVFSATWDGGMAWLVVVAAANTVASLFYYLRWLAPAFGTSSAEGAETRRYVRTGVTATEPPTMVAGAAIDQARVAAALATGVGALLLGVAAGPALDATTGLLVR